MPRSTRIRCTTAIAVLAALTLIAATSTKPFDPLESVPTGAIAVVTVGDPSALFLNAAGFLRGAGFDEAADSLEGFMENLLAPATGEADLAAVKTIYRAVDPGRRFIAAVYPGSASVDRPSALLFIPLRSTLSPADAEELTTAIDGILGSEAGSVSIATDYPGYAVIGTEGAVIGSYGSGATMNLSRLASYPASSVAVWADPGAGSQYLDLLQEGLGSALSVQDGDYQEDYEYWSEDMPLDAGEDTFVDNEAPVNNEAILDDATIVDNETPVDNKASIDNEDSDDTADSEAAALENGLVDNEYAEDFSWEEELDFETADAEMPANPFSGQLDQIGEVLKAGLEELAGVEFAVIVQNDRAWVRAGVELKAEGKLAPLARRAAAGDKSLPYLSYCEADALVSVAWSAPYDWSLPLVEALYALVLPNEELTAASMATMKAYAAAAGMNGGLSVGLEPSEELMQAIRSGSNPGNEAIVSMLARGLGLRVSGAIELADRQAFRDASAAALDIAADPETAALLASSGFSIDVSRAVGVMEGMPYDAYTYSFATQEESGAEAAAIAELMGKLISPVYFYAEDKAFFGLGPLKAAAAAIPKHGARQPIRADKTFKALRAGAPADTRAIFYLSTKALSKLVLRARPEDQSPLGYNTGKLSGLLSWFDASPTTAGFGLGIGAEDIKALKAILE